MSFFEKKSKKTKNYVAKFLENIYYIFICVKWARLGYKRESNIDRKRRKYFVRIIVK